MKILRIDLVHTYRHSIHDSNFKEREMLQYRSRNQTRIPRIEILSSDRIPSLSISFYEQ